MQIKPSAPAAPTRFRCKVGGEWKDLDQFSNAQQRKIQSMASCGQQVDPAHCGMTCKQHAAGSRAEMKCDLCNLTKPIDEFSKSSRRNGISECRRCIAWTEIQEPELTPGPLETGHISPEEVAQQSLRQQFFTSEDFFPDDDDEDLFPRAPITDFSSLGLNDSFGKAVGALSIDELVSQAKHSDPVISSAASVTSVRSTLPPHMRAKHRTASQAGSVASSTNGDISMPTTMREIDSDVASIASRRFNAWGPGGQLQRREATPALDSTSPSSAVSVSSFPASVKEDDDPNVVGDWSSSGRNVPPAKLGGKNPWGKGAQNKLSVAELRKMHGITNQGYVRPATEEQRTVRPLGYDDDDDSD